MWSEGVMGEREELVIIELGHFDWREERVMRGGGKGGVRKTCLGG